MLYPQESESREIKDLSGIWRFRADKDGCGRRDSWFAAPLRDTIPMPVPCSYNDVTQDVSIRDHLGEVWYETTFFVPASWRGKRVCLRFASADHAATQGYPRRQRATQSHGTTTDQRRQGRA